MNEVSRNLRNFFFSFIMHHSSFRLPFSFIVFSSFFFLFCIFLFFLVAQGFGTKRARLVDAACRGASLLFFFLFLFLLFPFLSFSFSLISFFFFSFSQLHTILAQNVQDQSTRLVGALRFARGFKNVPPTYWVFDFFPQNIPDFEI